MQVSRSCRFRSQRQTSKRARSDPEAFWLAGQLWPLRPLSVQPELGRIVHAGSDFRHPFQFRFYKEGIGPTVQNRTGSHLDGLVRVWPNTSGLKASRCTGITRPGFWQDATGPLPCFPHLDSVPFFHRRPG